MTTLKVKDLNVFHFFIDIYLKFINSDLAFINSIQPFNTFVKKNGMKTKLFEWIKRYGLAEILSLFSTVLASWITFEYTQSQFKMAIVATWAGNISYFGTILIQDIFEAKAQLKSVGKQYTTETFYKNVRALFVEFGIAEVFDAFLIRPTLLYYFPVWLRNLPLGVVVAKFTADITFYVPAIISYELSKKKLRNFE